MFTAVDIKQFKDCKGKPVFLPPLGTMIEHRKRGDFIFVGARIVGNPKTFSLQVFGVAPHKIIPFFECHQAASVLSHIDRPVGSYLVKDDYLGHKTDMFYESSRDVVLSSPKPFNSKNLPPVIADNIPFEHLFGPLSGGTYSLGKIWPCCPQEKGESRFIRAVEIGCGKQGLFVKLAHAPFDRVKARECVNDRDVYMGELLPLPSRKQQAMRDRTRDPGVSFSCQAGL